MCDEMIMRENIMLKKENMMLLKMLKEMEDENKILKEENEKLMNYEEKVNVEEMKKKVDELEKINKVYDDTIVMLTEDGRKSDEYKRDMDRCIAMYIVLYRMCLDIITKDFITQTDAHDNLDKMCYTQWYINKQLSRYCDEREYKSLVALFRCIGELYFRRIRLHDNIGRNIKDYVMKELGYIDVDWGVPDKFLQWKSFSENEIFIREKLKAKKMQSGK